METRVRLLVPQSTCLAISYNQTTRQPDSLKCENERETWSLHRSSSHLVAHWLVRTVDCLSPPYSKTQSIVTVKNSVCRSRALPLNRTITISSALWTCCANKRLCGRRNLCQVVPTFLDGYYWQPTLLKDQPHSAKVRWLESKSMTLSCVWITRERVKTQRKHEH